MPPSNPLMRDILIDAVTERMAADERVFFLSADFGSPRLDVLCEKFPGRFINVGIAEQNLVNVSVGMALEGHVVVAYAIAPFITMRCFEQVRVSLCLLSQVRPMNVNLVGVGAGFSYDVSGPTHQAMEDLSIMRTLPHLQVLSPCDWVGARGAVGYMLRHGGPKYVRLDGKPLPALYDEAAPPDWRRGFRALSDGADACLVGTGYMTHMAVQAAGLLAGRGRRVAVLDLFNLTHFDEPALVGALRRFPVIVSAEEGFSGRGGLDALLMSLFSRHGLSPRFAGLGLPPRYQFEMGQRADLLRALGLSPESMADKVMELPARD